MKYSELWENLFIVFPYHILPNLKGYIHVLLLLLLSFLLFLINKLFIVHKEFIKL